MAIGRIASRKKTGTATTSLSPQVDPREGRAIRYAGDASPAVTSVTAVQMRAEVRGRRARASR